MHRYGFTALFKISSVDFSNILWIMLKLCSKITSGLVLSDLCPSCAWYFEIYPAGIYQNTTTLTLFMLFRAEHEILLFTNVCLLIFISRINFMFNSAEHELTFMTLGPNPVVSDHADLFVLQVIPNVLHFQQTLVILSWLHVHYVMLISCQKFLENFVQIISPNTVEPVQTSTGAVWSLPLSMQKKDKNTSC